MQLSTTVHQPKTGWRHMGIEDQRFESRQNRRPGAPASPEFEGGDGVGDGEGAPE
jgi:hypothetical protein